MIHHYYHLWQPGEWQTPLLEHVAAIRDSDLRALTFINPVTEGWEQGTLNRLIADLPKMRDDDVVFYAHTKGAANPSEWNTSWRRTMQHFTITHWREMVVSLATHDMAGCWWISEAFHPNPHMQGSYWWARADYLKTLPSVSMDDRWKSELWPGQNNPRVYDAYPGSSGGSPMIGSPEFVCPLCEK